MIHSTGREGNASDTMMPGSSYSATFELAGAFDYFCSIHPYMTGKIIVSDRKPIVR